MEEKLLNNKQACLFSISSLGLGHATRTLAVIQSYLSTHRVHVLCTGNALAYLREELKNEGVTFYDFVDYPPLERGQGFMFYWYLVLDSFLTVWTIKREHSFVSKLCNQISPEFIISDGRYGSYSTHIPSFIISHQISFVMPKGLGLFQGFADYFNFKAFKKFDKVFIPDYKDDTHSLSGVLAHNKISSRLDAVYVGILSSLSKENVSKDIDYLFAISGYLAEHKPTFITNLIAQAKLLPGKKVFVLGNAKSEFEKKTIENDIEIYSSVSGKERRDLYNRARFVVSRSGYTTIMDLVELDIPGLLIPTPGQTEQEYLAKYLDVKKAFIVQYATIDLTKLRAGGWGPTFQVPAKTDASVQTIQKVVSSLCGKKA